MKNLKKTVLAVSGSTLGALLLAGSVQASPAVTPVVASSDNGTHASRSVSFADLNLSSAAGIAALHGRIEQAARQVCGSTDVARAGGVREASRNARCRKEAVAEAMSQIPTQSVAGTN